MAIAFVNSAELSQNNGTTNSQTSAYTVTAGSTLLLICFLGDLVNGNDDVTSVTYAGVNATLWLKDGAGSGPENNRFKYIYAVENPISGNNNVVINCTNTHYIIPGAAEYKGTSRAGPDATKLTDAGTGPTTVTGTITPVANNCWAFAFVEYNDGASDAPVASTGSTRRSFGSTYFNWGIFDSNGSISPPAAYSMTVTCPGTTIIDFIMDQVTFAPPAVEWADEPQHRLVRRPWRPRSQPDDTLVSFKPAPPWVQDPDYFPRRRVAWRARPQPLYEEFINNPTQFPAPPWVQDPDYFPRRRVAWRAHPEPLREEFLNNPTQFPAPPWVQDPDPPPRRRVAWRARPQPDDGPFTLAPVVYVEWADELRGLQIRRAAWRSKILSPDEFINNPTQFPAPPWVQDPDPPPRRRVPWRAHPQPDDTSGFPFTTGIVVYVEWGDELRGRQIRRLWHPRLQEEFIIIPPQPPWGWEPDQLRVPRRPRFARVQQDEPTVIPAAAAVVFVEWGDELRGSRIRRVRWLRRTVDEEWLFPLPPPSPPPPPSVAPFLSYEYQYAILVSAYNTGQLTVQQFYYALYKLQWSFSGAVDWNTSFTAPPSARPTTPPGDPPAIPIKPFPPTQMITNQADRVVDAGTLVATALSLLSLGCPPQAFPAPYPPRWAFQFYGGR